MSPHEVPDVPVWSAVLDELADDDRVTPQLQGFLNLAVPQGVMGGTLYLDVPNDLTAAHPRLAFGTRVTVTHLESNRFVFVRVNDRGPFIKARVIDLSQAAATALQMEKRGLAQVKLEVVE